MCSTSTRPQWTEDDDSQALINEGIENLAVESLTIIQWSSQEFSVNQCWANNSAWLKRIEKRWIEFPFLKSTVESNPNLYRRHLIYSEPMFSGFSAASRQIIDRR